MNAEDLIARLRERGHRLSLDGDEIVVRPRPNDATLDEIRRCRADVIAALQAAPLASEHRYVLWAGATDRDRSVCIACGKPPALHGMRALEGLLVVDDPGDVALIDARAVVASAAAMSIVSGVTR